MLVIPFLVVKAIKKLTGTGRFNIFSKSMVFWIRSNNTGFPVDELTSAVADLTRSQACLISVFADAQSLLGVELTNCSTRSLYLQRRWIGCLLFSRYFKRQNARGRKGHLNEKITRTHRLIFLWLATVHGQDRL